MQSFRRIIAAFRENARNVAAGPVEGEHAVLEILEERTRSILPRNFQVQRSEVSLRIFGVDASSGRSCVWTPTFVLRSKLPVEERLNIVFQSYAECVQRFMTNAQQSPWSARDACGHAEVGEVTISVWWGGPSEAEALMRLEPIARGELGIGETSESTRKIARSKMRQRRRQHRMAHLQHRRHPCGPRHHLRRVREHHETPGRRRGDTVWIARWLCGALAWRWRTDWG